MITKKVYKNSVVETSDLAKIPMAQADYGARCVGKEICYFEVNRGYACWFHAGQSRIHPEALDAPYYKHVERVDYEYD